MKSFITRIGLAGAASALLLFAACKRNDDGVKIEPRGPVPAWAPTITNEMLTIIEEYDSITDAPIYTYPAAQARLQKTVQDAAANVAARYGLSSPVYISDVSDQVVSINGGSLPVRVYRPSSGNGPFPGIIYYHGGGWVTGSNQQYDATARALADGTGSVVISIDCRKGPENKFPVAHNDAYGAYEWIMGHVSDYKIDFNHVAVAGEGSGANLACNVSIRARDAGIVMPKHQLLIYPIVQADTTTSSYTQYAAALPLGRTTVNYFLNNYLVSPAQKTDPRITLLNANLAGLPPTTIINAELDPLRDDGAQLENKLKSQGTQVSRKLYDGVTHDFFSMTAVLPQAREAQGVAFTEMRLSLGK